VPPKPAPAERPAAPVATPSPAVVAKPPAPPQAALAGPDVVLPQPDGLIDEMTFGDSEPELPTSAPVNLEPPPKADAPISLGDLDLGEPELLGLQTPSKPAMPTWTAPTEPVVADSLAEALATATQGQPDAPAQPPAPVPAPEPAPAVPAAVQTWFAEPEGTREDGRRRPTLADLALTDVNEDEVIEILTITVDQPVDAAALPEIPLFSDLSREAFVELASQCSLKRCQPEEVIVEQGTIGSSFFVVTSGSVKVVKKAEGGDVTLARLSEGSFFGEMALLSGIPRAASVVAEDEAECLEISADLLSSLIRRYPHVGQALKKFCRQRLLANVMATSPLFRPFGKDDRKGLVEKFKAREVNAQELVLTEGQPADGLYVVMMGELEVRKKSGGQEIHIAALKEGDVFGEISLLTKSAATATVAAVRRSTILRMPRAAFDEIISTHPQILMLVSELSDERLRAQQSFVQTNVGTDGLLLL